ncbi:hypothetical protein OSB04_015481 [Centaurea solstitialis]|uniref:Uncharacterized protein n=1 Tax=Centaurea solstitialis TaxID=347529 RepID=A0AA38WK72_9ASTR|nr:hypothetical protein OSB04_015481 [Centaurea solstitialis]
MNQTKKWNLVNEIQHPNSIRFLQNLRTKRQLSKTHFYISSKPINSALALDSSRQSKFLKETLKKTITNTPIVSKSSKHAKETGGGWGGCSPFHHRYHIKPSPPSGIGISFPLNAKVKTLEAENEAINTVIASLEKGLHAVVLKRDKVYYEKIRELRNKRQEGNNL